MKRIATLLTIILLTACKTESPAEIEDHIKTLSSEETVAYILSEDYKEILGIDEDGRQLLFNFYQNRAFKPMWSSKKSLNELGDTLYKLLRDPIQLGMSDLRFDLNWSGEEPIQNELVMTCGLIRSYFDLKYGILDSSMTALHPNRYIGLEYIDTLLDFSNKNFLEKFISWGPNDTLYQQLAVSLFEFVQQNPILDEAIVIPTWKEDSLTTVRTSKEILIAKSYLSPENESDTTSFIAALKKFQAENGCNPDGIIGAGTIRELTQTNRHKAQRISLAMEKQRRSHAYPSRYFKINIPEYTLRLHDSDTLCSENKIIIGTFDHQTPELTSALHSIVMYPYWNVPYSIASKEILPALKRNPNYLERNDMVLLRKGDTIDPHQVKWSKIKENAFPYKVVQQPGYKNSLGIVKFDFHNKYDVYFHDTPSKGLFNTVARSYSHGCMRTQNPIDLAKIVVELDKNVMVADSIDSLVARTGEHLKIRLNKKIPIFIVYQSVLMENKKVRILRDIYHRDDKYIAIMFGKPAAKSA